MDNLTHIRAASLKMLCIYMVNYIWVVQREGKPLLVKNILLINDQKTRRTDGGEREKQRELSF